MKTLFFLIIATIGVAAQAPPPIEPGVSQSLAEWRSARYSNVRYKLNLTLEKMSPVLKGTIEIRVKVSEPPAVAGGLTRSLSDLGSNGNNVQPPATAGGSDRAIILDWRKLPGHYDESTVSNVSINGTKLWALPEGYFILKDHPPLVATKAEHLIFSDGVVEGENVIKLDFTSPILTSGSAITRYIDKEDGSEYIYSLFVPSDASTAFPVFDQPDLKARFELVVTAPPGWKIVSNSMGLTESWTSKDFLDVKYMGASEYSVGRFPETKPISTYIFAFAAGPFERVSEPGAVATGSAASSNADAPKNQVATAPRSDTRAELSSHIYVRKSQAAKFQPHAAEVFRLNRECIKYLETYFDYKFPWPKYDLVLIPEFPFGGMEHAGATFLRESSVIFPTEPTKGDYITRANLIFHEAAHQWFGDTVTMKWFDDLWLKEGFAEFMAYKTLEKVMPDANSWKVFYERNKQAAYATDSTKGTTPIYQKIDNLSAAKSAYGNIVYRKAPSFLRQAEFYLGEQKFQTAVREFLKKNEFANAGWEDLVKEFEGATKRSLGSWADAWIKRGGVPLIRADVSPTQWSEGEIVPPRHLVCCVMDQVSKPGWPMQFNTLVRGSRTKEWTFKVQFTQNYTLAVDQSDELFRGDDRFPKPLLFFPNYQDYGYGIFLLDDQSREYVLKNIQNEKDPFLRSMMWGALWDSVREAELDPREYVEVAIRALSPAFRRPAAGKKAPEGGTQSEDDETIIASVLGRVGTAMSYYLDPASRERLTPQLENVLLDRLQHAETAGMRVTFYRAFVSNASTAKGREVLKEMLRQGSGGNPSGSAGAQDRVSATSRTLPTGRVSASTPVLRTKDKFDIVTRLIILGDPDGLKLLADLEKTETSDDAKRYAYAAHAAVATRDNKAKFWNDFVNNKDISESWIEAAAGPFNNIRHAELTRGYLEQALAELPNLKRTRKIFFINNWLSAWIGGQRDEKALALVNKFLADNPNLDRDLRLKILENVDLIERAVKIRKRWNH